MRYFSLNNNEILGIVSLSLDEDKM